MGNVVFWICFIGLLVVLALSAYNRGKKNAEERRRLIRENFGKRDVSDGEADTFENTPYLYEVLCDACAKDHRIDDITSNDLSLRTVYSRINRCLTKAGEDYLYCRLMIMPYSHDEPASFYGSVKEYIDNEKKAVDCLYALDGYRKRREQDDLKLITSIKDASSSGISYDICCIGIVILSIMLIGVYPVAGLVAVLASLIISIGMYFSGRNKMGSHLYALATVMRITRISDALSKCGCSDFDRYEKLSYLRRWDFLISYKDVTTSNPLDILFDYLRMISHIDLIAYKIKISKVKQYSDGLADLYKDIGRLDAAIAVASFVKSRRYCRADLTDDMIVKGVNIYHPLINDPVCNDIEASRGALITGSNASGKSTFLKAMGINAIFASSFGLAFADSFVTGVSAVYSSMALADDIIGAKSYYVVEAESIKRITDTVVSDKRKALVLIDEIFRGTNTKERIAASTAILKYLCRDNVLCFAATHDIELTQLLKDEMDMYYFTEEIHEDNVTFPFVIHKGVSDRTNALSLLVMLGFDDSVADTAVSLVNRYKSTGSWI